VDFYCVLCFCLILCLRFSISWVTSSLTFSIFIFNSFISLFIVFSVSLWCLFRTPLNSFICFCVFSHSLFLVSWNFLTASYTLTMSTIFSMKLSVISSFSVFLWPPLGALLSFITVVLGSGTRYPFSSFPSESYWSFFLLHMVLWNYDLDRLVGGFIHLFSFPWFNFCFVAVLVCYFCPWSVCNLSISNLQFQYLISS
jgi:hypothetical protein